VPKRLPKLQIVRRRDPQTQAVNEKIARLAAIKPWGGISQRVVGRSISPHKYRHAFVTDTINGGAASRVVQKMVGHSSVKTTMDYMHSDLERVRAEYLRAHPRGAER
jgi:site-specific recombinase XerD